MSAREDEGDPLPFFTALAVGVGAVGLFAAYFLTSESTQRLGAFVGVAEAAVSGMVALPLKRWALTRSVKWALAMMGVVFGVRVVLVTGGLLYVVRSQLSPMAYVVGFFGVYFVLQWIEVSYVLAEMRRRGQGGF